MKPFAILSLALLLLAAIPMLACDSIKDEVNERTEQTKNLKMAITDDWVPLYAIQYESTELNAVCYQQPISFDGLVAESDYAEWWNDIKAHISEINIQHLSYAFNDNQATNSGYVYLYLIGEDEIPPPLEVQGFGMDDLMDDPAVPLIFVDPADLPEDSIVAYVPIEPGVDVPDYTDAGWQSGGKDLLQEQLLSFSEPFSFCLTITGNDKTINDISDLSSLDPVVRIVLRIDLDIVFVPLS